MKSVFSLFSNIVKGRRRSAKSLLTIAFFVLIFSSCGENGTSILGGESALPENPKKIEIRWFSGGGMLPEGEDIFISADSCYWNRWQDQCKLHLDFKMTDAEVRSLYQVFLDHDFNDIDMLEEQEVYDRGGTSIDVNCDNIYYQKSNSGMSFVMENDWDDYGAIENAIYSATMERVEKFKMKSTVKLSDNLIKSGLVVNLTVNHNALYDSSKDSLKTKKTEFNETVYQGENQFTMSLFDPDSLNNYGYMNCLTTVWFVKSISDTSNTVVFDYADGVLVGK